ncbi:MAG: germination protein YpeB [Clostridia bacterium]|nr:germination protein YpeB [Clostridia bacterium]
MKRLGRSAKLAVVFGVLLSLSLGANAVQSEIMRRMQTSLSMERQRDLTDVARAMADIEINLQKLLIASGASQSAQLLGETALLAQHVESGISRLPMSMETAADAMKFAGQMGDYVMTLARQVSGGNMLSSTDEAQIEGLLAACQGLNAHLMDMGENLYADAGTVPDGGEMDAWPDAQRLDGSGIDYPSLIYDGPFSDGKTGGAPKGLTGERITREQARQAAARYAGAAVDQVAEAADSGGQFEAFGFTAQTQDGSVSVQVTGQGGHLLWMMPEAAEFEKKVDQQACLNAAQAYLAEMGFGEMERCFVQEYDGMVVANFAAVQDGVLLYPDQVKLQISMASGRVVGAECSQYLTNHYKRQALEPGLALEQAQLTLSSRLEVEDARVCVIPTDAGEKLCWEFKGTFSGETYYAYVDAQTGEAVEILRIARTQTGEMAI